MSTPEQTPRTPDSGPARGVSRRATRGRAASRESQLGPAMSQSGVPLARVRRSPRVIPFLVTGALLGAIVGLVIATTGGDGGNYTDTSSTGYLLVLCGGLGLLLGGVAFALADRRA